MPLSLNVQEYRTGGGTFADSSTLTQESASYGAGVLPDLNLGLSNGTGNGQANKQYLRQRTVAAGGNDDLDLAGGLTDFQGAAITFTAIKRLLLAVISPDGTKVLRLGPAGVANAWQGPWGGTGATVYETVYSAVDKIHPYAGWAVVAGTGDILRVTNPGAAPVTYAIWLLGVG